MHTPLKRAWVEIDLGALMRNGAAMAARGAALIPMVKGDAYGLGAVPVTRALDRLDPWGFGVATVEEGRALRDAGIERPVIVFTPVHGPELDDVRAARLTPILARGEDIAAWRGTGGGDWQLAIDTGMSRCGVRWSAMASLAAETALSAPQGAYTHFHSAETDPASVIEQERRFEQALGALRVRPRMLHTENSAALARRDRSPWTHARPGIFLYGVGSGLAVKIAPEPVVSLRARIVALRTVGAGDTVSYDATWRAGGERTIATAAIGYADGYRRSFSGRGAALLGGRRVSVAGIVTMDMTMLDVTGVPCAIGDVATFIGRDGASLITVEDAAALGELSPYELLTGLGQRLEHSYRGAP
jgi:alanine racemase